MEKKINQEMKELNIQYSQGLLDRFSHQMKRSNLIDEFVMSNSGNETVQVSIQKPKTAGSDNSDDILQVAEKLSVTDDSFDDPAKNKSNKKINTLKRRELLLILSGVMIVIAGCLLYFILGN